MAHFRFKSLGCAGTDAVVEMCSLLTPSLCGQHWDSGPSAWVVTGEAITWPPPQSVRPHPGETVNADKFGQGAAYPFARTPELCAETQRAALRRLARLRVEECHLASLALFFKRSSTASLGMRHCRASFSAGNLPQYSKS